MSDVRVRPLHESVGAEIEGFDPSEYRLLIFGLAMVVMMIWRPRGLVSTREPTVFLKERKTISADLVKEGHG